MTCKFCKTKMDVLTHNNGFTTAGRDWCSNCGALRTIYNDYDQYEKEVIVWQQPKKTEGG